MSPQVALVLLPLFFVGACSIVSAQGLDAKALKPRESIETLKTSVQQIGQFQDESRKFLIRIELKLHQSEASLKQAIENAALLKKDLLKLKALLSSQEESGEVRVNGRSIQRSTIEMLTKKQIAKLGETNGQISVLESSIESIRKRKSGLEDRRASIEVKRTQYEKKIKALQQKERQAAELNPLFEEFDSYEEWYQRLLTNPLSDRRQEIEQEANTEPSTLEDILDPSLPHAEVLDEIDGLLGGE